MNAQAFFEMCRGVTEESTLQPVTSFNSVDEDEFIDFEDEQEFLNQDEVETVTEESAVSTLADVTVAQSNVAAMGDTLCDYFKDWLCTNIDVSEDCIADWNKHAKSSCSTIEECVREFALMHFGVKFIGDTSVQQIKFAKLDSCGLPCPVSVEDWLRLKESGCSMYDLQLLSQNLEEETARKLILRDDYSRDEALKYMENPEELQLYAELKLKNCFIPEKFETAICRTVDGGLLRDNYFDKDSILFEIVTDNGTEIVELLQHAINKGVQITPEFLRTFKSAGLLQTVLTARVNDTVNSEIEKLLLRNPEAPEWFRREYCDGKLVGGDVSKSPFYCSATAECLRRNINCEELEDSKELTKLLELHHTCRISETNYLKLLYCLTRRVDISDMISTTFKSFEHYWISKILNDAGIEAVVPGFVGDMLVIVNADGKIRLLDVEMLVYDYARFKDTLTEEYQVELLLDNKGVLLVHKTRKSLIPKLIGIRYAAPSSLGRWIQTQCSIDTFGDPGRCNLYQLEYELGDSVPTGLKAWEHCPLNKYQQADRCFGYVLDVVPEAKYLFCFKDTQKIIRNVLTGIQITDKTAFVWHFLKNFFRDGYNCRVFEKSKKKNYTTDEITLELDGQISRISAESFMLGFIGIEESTKVLGNIALDNTQGKIYVKICKKFV